MKIPCSVFNVCSNSIVLKVSVQSGCCLVCENAHNCKIVMVSPEKIAHLSYRIAVQPRTSLV